MRKNTGGELVNKKSIFAIILVAGIFLFSCAPKSVNLTEQDNGKEITVNKGSAIVIKLPSNPTTGFDWYIRQLPENLQQEGAKTYIPSKSDKNLLGAGGTTEFKFKAVKSGEGTLILIYKRNWEGVTSKNKQFEVKINVR